MPIAPGSRYKPITGSWPTRAACAGRPELLEGDVQAAKDLCMSCPVIRDCTRWVIPLRGWEDPGGVVAGMTETERNRARNRARGIRSLRSRNRNRTRSTPMKNGTS